MNKKQLFGIAYVSVWVLIWGTIGSLVDLPFLNSDVYIAGSIGQAITFISTAIISTLIAIWLYPIALTSNFLIAALGLDTDKKA